MEIELDSVEGLYLRGCISQRLGDVQSAIRDFGLVLASDPYHFNARLARAACYNYVGDFDRAIEDYESGLNTEESTNRVAKRIFNIKNALSTDVLINPIDHEDFRLESPVQTKHDSFYRDRTPVNSTLTSVKAGSEKAPEASLLLSALLPSPSPGRKQVDAAEADRYSSPHQLLQTRTRSSQRRQAEGSARALLAGSPARPEPLQVLVQQRLHPRQAGKPRASSPQLPSSRRSPALQSLRLLQQRHHREQTPALRQSSRLLLSSHQPRCSQRRLLPQQRLQPAETRQRHRRHRRLLESHPDQPQQLQSFLQQVALLREVRRPPARFARPAQVQPARAEQLRGAFLVCDCIDEGV